MRADAQPFRGSYRGLLWIVLAVFSFSVLALLIRLSSHGLHFTQVAFVRSIVGASLALASARVRKTSLRVRRQRLAWGRSLVGAVAMLAYFYSMGAPDLALGDVATLRATAPVLTASFAWLLLKRSGGPRLAVALCVSLIGVVAIAQPSLSASPHVVGAALVCALFCAGTDIFLHVLRDESHEAVVLHFSLVSAALMGAFAWSEWRLPDLQGWSMLVAAGVAGGIGQLAMTRAHALEHPGRVSCVGYVGVVFALLWGVTFLGEALAPYQIAGGALVVGGGLLLLARGFLEAHREIGREIGGRSTEPDLREIGGRSTEPDLPERYEPQVMSQT